MKRHVLVLFLLVFSVPLLAQARTYTLAIQPCWLPEKTLMMFTPLADYLGYALGGKVELVLYDNSEQFHHNLSKVDMVLQDIYSAYRHKRWASFQIIALAVNGKGETTERGAIIVRKDSPYHKLTDLKGKRFLFGSLHNTSKFFSTWILFRKHGIDPRKDFAEIDLGGD